MLKLRFISLFIMCLMLTSCAASDNYGADAEANKTQTLEIDTTLEQAYRTAIQVAAEQSWNIQNSDSDAGFFRAETPGSMRAWQDEVNVTIAERGGVVRITVKSNLGQAPNRRIVADFLNSVEGKLRP